MTARPVTRYAWNGNAALAYQVDGDGPIDIVLQIGFASQLDLNWESPRRASFMRGLAGHGRLIVSERRGMGLSERYAPADIPPLEITADDMIAVLDAAGSERAVIMTTGGAGFTATYLAAAHPNRVAGIVLFGFSPMFAGFSPTFAELPDATWAWSDPAWDEVVGHFLNDWGRTAFVDYLGVDYLDAAEPDSFVRWCAASAAPGGAAHEVRHWAVTRGLLSRFRGTEMDTAGDGFFCTFDGPARAVRCAQAIAAAMRPLGIEVRAGVHTGEVEMIAGKAGGIAASIGARVASKAGPSEVLVSSTVKDLVAGSGLGFEDTGEHELKGVPDRWRLYRVVS
jgi:pimeloyl-ACP methyl ester carboxylesterase